MDRKTSNILLIAGGALLIGGWVLLLISIFSETNDNWALSYAFMAIILSNLFNIIYIQMNSKVYQGKTNSENSGRRKTGNRR